MVGLPSWQCMSARCVGEGPVLSPAIAEVFLSTYRLLLPVSKIAPHGSVDLILILRYDNQVNNQVLELCSANPKIMGNFIDCLADNSKLNLIYTLVLLATADSIRLHGSYKRLSYYNIIMDIDLYSQNPQTEDLINALQSNYSQELVSIIAESVEQKPCLLIRIARRFALLSDKFIVYIQNQFNEHTATSIASFSVLVIVVSMIFCFIISLMREEERRLKEQYKKLNTGSSQSFIAIGEGCRTGTKGTTRLGSHLADGGKNDSSGNPNQCFQPRFQFPIGGQHFHHSNHRYTNISPSTVSRSDSNKLHIIELRRETYFGLVRLLKPGCRTIVLLCDAQSRRKLLSRFYQCIYPYRKNKTLQFAFLLIEKNIGWYKDLLRLALNEKRDLDINPINCIGTVLVLNGFKKYFSVYHASDSNFDPDEPFVLLEETLMDNFSDWLERLFAGRASRYYVKYWPGKMR